MKSYNEFLKSKYILSKPVGIEIDINSIHEKLFPFQRDIVYWACRKGRALIGLDTGLGKTFIQLEWARLMAKRTLIIAPLSVSRQTIREAKKINIDVTYVRSQDQVVGDGIFITNYEMAEHFDADYFDAVVLDESSILKAIEGKTRRLLTSKFQDTKYRLCCTATPAPNDPAEIGMHAEYLGVMKNNEMLASFFIHANKVTEQTAEMASGKLHVIKTKQPGINGQEWRLRNHGKKDFYKWLSSWAMMMSKPSDLGYDDNGYILPELKIIPEFVDVKIDRDGQLFFTGLRGIQDRTEVRRSTLAERILFTVDQINNNQEQWIVWCGLQQEADEIAKLIPDAIQVQGSDTSEYKAEMIEAFQDGKYRILITKPKIAGFGMNFQNAHNMIFVGLGDSWEAYYQCIRREWRFGQKSPVNVFIVLSEVEREIYDNIMRKEAMASEMKRELISYIEIYEKDELHMDINIDLDNEYREDTIKGDDWIAMLGDSGKRLQEIEDETIDMSVYSPPFADLYTYSNSARDLGNARDWDEFFEHYKFIISEMYRIHKPGTETCVHTADIPAIGIKDGYIGLKDFPGEVIRAHEEMGWVYHGWAVVAKNPQAQAIRTKAKALLFVQLKKDSSDSRPAILDRILIFKKPGDRDNPVTPVDRGEIDNERWIEWAGGIWTGINESDTLQFTTARDPEDEKHICPLQLGTIERCIKLYSNPGELVLTPFMGIGSEAYQAIKYGRKAIGVELKASYFRIAVQNLQSITSKKNAIDLFSMHGINI